MLLLLKTRVNAVVLGKFLANKGFEYEVVENGQLAVERVQQRHFDCVLMDNHMPEMDGIEAARTISSLNLDNPPIIIGCTADAFEHTRQKMISEGCTEVITKPVSSENRIKSSTPRLHQIAPIQRSRLSPDTSSQNYWGSSQSYSGHQSLIPVESVHQ